MKKEKGPFRWPRQRARKARTEALAARKATSEPALHIYTRPHYICRLHLDPQQKESQTTTDDIHDDDTHESSTRASVPRHYINQMRGISLKTQQRLSTETKRSFCKRCDLLLIPGVTSTEEVENQSKDRQKPWADVLVVRCKACETVKRFPQSQKRSAKLFVRKQERNKKMQN